MKTTSQQRADLEEKTRAATPGPWTKDGPYKHILSSIGEKIINAQWQGNSADEDGLDADMEFVAAANPATILALLDDLKEAEESWRCFQCGEVLTTEPEARLHFSLGSSGPACVDPLRGDEKACLEAVYRAREEEARWRKEAAEADHERSLLRSYQSELGRLFGTCGGSPVSTPHQAWLVLDYEKGRTLVEKERAEKAEADLAKAVQAYGQATGLLKAQLAETRAELAATRERAVQAARTLIAEIGADGPENVEGTVGRAVSVICGLKAELAIEKRKFDDVQTDYDNAQAELDRAGCRQHDPADPDAPEGGELSLCGRVQDVLTELDRLEEYNRTLTRSGCSGCETLRAELVRLRAIEAARVANEVFWRSVSPSSATLLGPLSIVDMLGAIGRGEGPTP